MKSIDILITSPHLQRFGGVAAFITINYVPELLKNTFRHAPQLYGYLICPFLIADLLRTLCNVRREIADALKIIRNAQSPNYFT